MDEDRADKLVSKLKYKSSIDNNVYMILVGLTSSIITKWIVCPLNEYLSSNYLILFVLTVLSLVCLHDIVVYFTLQACFSPLL